MFLIDTGLGHLRVLSGLRLWRNHTHRQQDPTPSQVGMAIASLVHRFHRYGRGNGRGHHCFDRLHSATLDSQGLLHWYGIMCVVCNHVGICVLVYTEIYCHCRYIWPERGVAAPPASPRPPGTQFLPPHPPGPPSLLLHRHSPHHLRSRQVQVDVSVNRF